MPPPNQLKASYYHYLRYTQIIIYLSWLLRSTLATAISMFTHLLSLSLAVSTCPSPPLSIAPALESNDRVGYIKPKYFDCPQIIRHLPHRSWAVG